jgi:hypothetical protein
LNPPAALPRKSNIDVKVDPQKHPHGRFAGLHDPEGNPIERWEAASPGSADRVGAAARQSHR